MPLFIISLFNASFFNFSRCAVFFNQLKKWLGERPRQNQDYSQTSRENVSNGLETELNQLLKDVGILENVHKCCRLHSGRIARPLERPLSVAVASKLFFGAFDFAASSLKLANAAGVATGADSKNRGAVGISMSAAMWNSAGWMG
jgi:hypothetical protein